MTSHSRSVTPSRRYGDIIGSIFSNGSGELEEGKKSSILQVKQKFRERRQKHSPGRSLGRNPTPERRQNPSSPVRQYNEKRIRSSSRPPTPDRINSRPPTPDRRQFQSQTKKPMVDSSGRGFIRNNRLSSGSQLEPLQLKSKGISTRSLSLSPTKRRDRVVDFSESVDTLTTRIANQVSQNMKKKVAGTITSEPLEQELGQVQNHQGSQMDNEIKQETTRTIFTKLDDRTEHVQRAPISEGLSAKTGPEAGASVLNSPGDVNQMKDTIQAQNEQIKFYEIRLKKQSSDIEQLAVMLKLSKKNESKLDLELEIHDLKYSMYDDYRRMMDRQRLDSIYDKEEVEIEREFESALFSRSYDAFAKLNHLDQLYEKSKLEAESRFSFLQEEYNKIVSNKSVSDGEISRHNCNAASLDTVVTSTNLKATSDLLENRIKMLESENLIYSLEIKKKEEELEKVKSVQNDSTSRKEENLFNNHNLEKQTLKNKIIALETEIGFTSGHINDKTRTRRYRALEKNLNDYVAEIMGLEDQLKAKEKKISKLKEMDSMLNFGSEKKNVLDCHLSMASAEWYDVSNNGQKGLSSNSVYRMRMPVDQSHGYASESTAKNPQPNTKEGGKEVESSKTSVGDNIDAVSTDILELKNRMSKAFSSYDIGSRKSSNRRGPSSSSTRIKMLRKRLDALANEHSSVCTEDTQFSSKTSP